MPVFAILYFFFILSNFGFPGTVNFVGEFLILLGGFEFSNVIIFFSTLGTVLSLIYSLFFYGRIFFVRYLNFLLDFIVMLCVWNFLFCLFFQY